MGAVGSTVGTVVGGIMASNTAEDAQNAALQATQDAVNMINAIGAGPDLAREIYIEKYRQAGVLTPELENQIDVHFQQMQGPSQGVTAAQKQALEQLKGLSKTGITAQDRLVLAQMQTQTARDQEAQKNAIIQNLAARGQAGGGAELAARLSASQNAGNQEAMGGLQIAANAQQRALQALGAMGQQAGQMRGQEFAENQANTNIANEQNRFNVATQLAQQQRNVGAKNAAQQYNLTNKQNIENANVDLGNTERRRQRDAEQQMYVNKSNQAKAAANARLGQGTQALEMGYQNAAGQAAMGAGIGRMGGSLMDYFKGMGQGGTGYQDADYDPYATYSGNSPGPWAADYGGGASTAATGEGGMMSGWAMNQGGVVPDGQPQDFRHGGYVPGKAPVPGDSPKNDIVNAKLSPDELVIPRSIAHSPEKSKKFIDLIHEEEIKKPHPKKMNQGGMAGYADGGMVEYPLPPQAHPMGQLPSWIQDYLKTKSDAGIAPSVPSPEAPQQPSIFDSMLNGIAMAGPGGGSVAPTSDNSLNPNPMTLGQDMRNAGPQIIQGSPDKNVFQEQEEIISPPKKATEAPKAMAKQEPMQEAPKGDAQPDLSKYASVLKAGMGSSDEAPDYLQQLKDAYGKKHQNEALAGLVHGAEQFAGGAARTKPDYSNSQDFMKMAGEPVDELGAGLKFQDAAQKVEFNKQLADKNSKISKLFQDVAIKYGIAEETARGTSAEDLSKIMPSLFKSILAEEKSKLAVGEKAKKGQADIVKHVDTLLESGRTTPDYRQAKLDAYNIQKAKGLIKANYGDLDNMSQGQVALLAAEIGKIATGGVPKKEEMKALVPNTIQQKLAGLWQSFGGKPTPAQAGEFIKQYQQYLNELDHASKGVINDRIGRILEINKEGLGEENYNKYRTQYPEYAGPGGSPAASGDEKVRVKDPKGTIRLIPKSQVENAVAAGGQLVE